MDLSKGSIINFLCFLCSIALYKVYHEFFSKLFAFTQHYVVEIIIFVGRKYYDIWCLCKLVFFIVFF